jgi:hypothetical protein
MLLRPIRDDDVVGMNGLQRPSAQHRIALAKNLHRLSVEAQQGLRRGGVMLPEQHPAQCHALPRLEGRCHWRDGWRGRGGSCPWRGDRRYGNGALLWLHRCAAHEQRGGAQHRHDGQDGQPLHSRLMKAVPVWLPRLSKIGHEPLSEKPSTLHTRLCVTLRLTVMLKLPALLKKALPDDA